MKLFLIAAAVAVATTTNPALAAGAGASLSVGQPGFHARLDIGGDPQPRLIYLIYRQPRINESLPMGRPPIHLRVPPGHASHWGRHCANTFRVSGIAS